MKKTQIILPLVLFILLFILNFEYFFLNAEGIFIISFLLFTICFYVFAGDMVGSILDDTTNDISRKLKELSSLQRVALKENKDALEKIKHLNNKFIPLLLVIILLVEQREALLEDIQLNMFRNLIEKKCKELLIEQATFTLDLNNIIIKEVIEHFENNLIAK
jgi:hypothetical protein